MSTSLPTDESANQVSAVDHGVAPRRSPLIPIGIVVGVLGVLLLGQALFHRASAQTNNVPLAASAKPVTVVAARAAQYRAHRRYVGTLEPWVEAHVGPQIISAYVSTVLVRPGAVVRRGEVLATLDCRNAHATSEAVADQARAVEARQRALAAQAGRMTGLLDGGFVAPNEVEQRQAESASEQARLSATRAQLAGSALAVSDCVLRAPFDGEVATRNVDPGAFVRPGAPVIGLVERSTVRVTADVPETDFDAVGPGTPVQLRILATGREINGTVARRSPAADVATRTVHIEIDLPNTDLSVPVNTTADLNVEVGAPRPASEIPLTAANVRGARANVFVVENGVAHARTVAVLGERAGDLFVDARLAPGAMVVTEGRGLLADNDRVAARVEEAPASPAAAQETH